MSSQDVSTNCRNRSSRQRSCSNASVAMDTQRCESPNKKSDCDSARTNVCDRGFYWPGERTFISCCYLRNRAACGPRLHAVDDAAVYPFFAHSCFAMLVLTGTADLSFSYVFAAFSVWILVQRASRVVACRRYVRRQPVTLRGPTPSEKQERGTSEGLLARMW